MPTAATPAQPFAPATPTVDRPATAVTPYLMFDGNAREAMAFYQQHLGGELGVMTYRESGACEDATVPAALLDRVIHARLASGTLVLLASDTPGHTGPLQRGDDTYLNLACASVEALEHLYAALGEGGRGTLAPHDAFWGARFAMLTDRFGVRWMLHHEYARPA